MKDIVSDNEKIDKCFKRVQCIADEYLSMNYPAAPDPDVYIERIEKVIQEYRKI